MYHQLKTSKNATVTFDENQLNYLGNELRRAKKIQDAIKIFELNVHEYPKSVLAYESLGETYRRNKHKENAIRCFEKARELDPENQHWTFILESFKGAERKRK